MVTKSLFGMSHVRIIGVILFKHRSASGTRAIIAHNDAYIEACCCVRERV